MSNFKPESPELTAAIERMSSAMEQLQARYDESQRSNRLFRIILVVIVLAFAVVTYQTVLPVIEIAEKIPQIIPGLKPASNLPGKDILLERQEFIASLPEDSSSQIKQFEIEHQLMAQYLSLIPDFNSSATVALFLYKMSQSMQFMPKMYDEMRVIKEEMQIMNAKMNALPGLGNDIHAMQVQMNSLPILTNEVKAMNGQIYNISRDIDSTMGSAGRFIPW